jgi:uncharacterized SAM-binding protein YcdF (DUF218 family)
VWLLLKYCKSLLRNLLLPPAGPLLLGLLGLVLLQRRPRLARVLLAVSIASLWLLSTPWVADALTVLAEGSPALELSQVGQAQAIVILGGGGQRAFAPEYNGPAAEPYLLEKLAYGAYLARHTGLPILLTGYHVEAIAMRDSLARNFGLRARWIDDQAYDTFENARNSAGLLRADGIGRVLLLTRATHMRRSLREFRAAGIESIAAPVGVYAPRDTGAFRLLPSPEALLRSYMASYELIGEPVRELLAATHLRRH